MKSILCIASSVLAYLTLIALPAQAERVAITGQIISLEASYMPDSIHMEIRETNSPPTSCASHSLIWKKGPIENIKAVYATALAALVSGKQVNFVIDSVDPNPDVRCVGQFFSIINK